MPRQTLETELKIPVEDLDTVRAALRAAGASVVQPMARETNVLLDTEDGRLRNAGSILRLREHAENRRLTFKGPAVFRGAVKEREEYETEVSDPVRMGEILERLGYRVVMRYEKDREEWRLGETSIVLDRTPMGFFVEVEGRPKQLERLAVGLGLDVNDAVRASYVSLWQEHRASHPELDLPFDMVFAG